MKEINNETIMLIKNIQSDGDVLICSFGSNITTYSPYGNPTCTIHNLELFKENEQEIKQMYDTFVAEVEARGQAILDVNM